MLMNGKPRLGATALAMLLLAAVPAHAGTPDTELPRMDLNGDVDAGKEIAMNRSKGNCIACHFIPGGDAPGAIGPALIAIQTRYPNKEAVARQIWDPTAKNPDVVMPPFGKHGILTNQEFVDVVEYVWSL